MNKINDETLTHSELVSAGYFWIKNQQLFHFHREIEACKTQAYLPKGSKIIGLNPFYDHDSILRANGRTKRSSLPYEATHPAILPSNSRLTELIVKDSHIRTCHGGAQLMSQYIRHKYWVVNIRKHCKKIIHQCLPCFRHKKETCGQLMGQLPEPRVTPGRPFSSTGIDFCGPFTIKARSGKCKTITKGYVAVFVCMETRAINLELVSDLSSEAFIAALRRFSSRRGRILQLYSDNGTTFIGANRQLQEIHKSIHRSRRTNDFQAMSIKWTFITPNAPHQGGIWEAGVRSVKHHLKRVIGETHLTFEEMVTILTQIEVCLNSRPIAAISDDINDQYPLTPAHFLPY